MLRNGLCLKIDLTDTDSQQVASKLLKYISRNVHTNTHTNTARSIEICIWRLPRCNSVNINLLDLVRLLLTIWKYIYISISISDYLLPNINRSIYFVFYTPVALDKVWNMSSIFCKSTERTFRVKMADQIWIICINILKSVKPSFSPLKLLDGTPNILSISNVHPLFQWIHRSIFFKLISIYRIQLINSFSSFFGYANYLVGVIFDHWQNTVLHLLFYV